MRDEVHQPDERPIPATTARREAQATRRRARKLAIRFLRRLRRRYANERRTLAARRDELATRVAEFNALRSDFHALAVAMRDRLAEAWGTIDTHQRRIATEWTEANHYIAAQVAALDARATRLDKREKSTANRLAAAEAETAGLREESAALEQRVQNARTALAELEQRRDRARAELLHIEVPLVSLEGPNADDLAHRELLLEREKAAVAALRSSLELESADLNDRRRLVAEQLTQLTEARVQWQRAERQTVVEMEELARALACREQTLDARETRLIRAETRRREEAHELWRLRVRLEAWEARLTALAMPGQPSPPADAEELIAVRAEVERLAASILEFPDTPERPANEEPVHPVGGAPAFEPGTRAA